MDTIRELSYYVSSKAREYVVDTGETIDKFPMSIVDFVIEYAIEQCHFPKNFSEKQIVSDLSKSETAAV